MLHYHTKEPHHICDGLYFVLATYYLQLFKDFAYCRLHEEGAHLFMVNNKASSQLQRFWTLIVKCNTILSYKIGI